MVATRWVREADSSCGSTRTFCRLQLMSGNVKEDVFFKIHERAVLPIFMKAEQLRKKTFCPACLSVVDMSQLEPFTDRRSAGWRTSNNVVKRETASARETMAWSEERNDDAPLSAHGADNRNPLKLLATRFVGSEFQFLRCSILYPLPL